MPKDRVHAWEFPQEGGLGPVGRSGPRRASEGGRARPSPFRWYPPERRPARSSRRGHGRIDPLVSPHKRHPEIRGLYALMERYIDGDPAAFTRLHAQLSPRLRGLLMKLVRDEAAVDDLAQLTLLKAHLARERFALQGGDPDGAVQGWYFAIARNVAMDFLRRRYRSERRHAGGDEGEDPVAELADTGPDAEELGLQAEQEAEIVQRVRAAIEQLSPGQREVVELHKLQGMSMAEIAERLQIREGAVRVRAHRAYRALARLLGSGGASLWPLLVLLADAGPKL